MSNIRSDDYVDDSANLVNNFQKLITRCYNLIKNKEGEESIIDLHVNQFIYYLAFHQLQIERYYPLNKTTKQLITDKPMLESDKIKLFIIAIDHSLKSSFITMCCFQIETLLRRIAETNNVDVDNRSICTKFESVLKYFDIPVNDKLGLVNVLYWTRNTLHNGMKVDKPGICIYAGHKYVFEIGKTINHAYWNNFIYFVNEIIGIFEEILNRVKDANDPKKTNTA